MIIVHRITLTASGGDASANTNRIAGIMKLLQVVPAAETTTYSVKLTDPDGEIVYNSTGKRGTFRDTSELPVNGVYTLAITGSSVATSAFTVKIIIDEVPSA